MSDLYFGTHREKDFLRRMLRNANLPRYTDAILSESPKGIYAHC